MSSAMVTLQNILPHRVLCHLGIEIFHSFAAAEYLTRIIEEVLNDYYCFFFSVLNHKNCNFI